MRRLTLLAVPLIACGLSLILDCGSSFAAPAARGQLFICTPTASLTEAQAQAVAQVAALSMSTIASYWLVKDAGMVEPTICDSSLAAGERLRACKNGSGKDAVGILAFSETGVGTQVMLITEDGVARVGIAQGMPWSTLVASEGAGTLRSILAEMVGQQGESIVATGTGSTHRVWAEVPWVRKPRREAGRGGNRGVMSSAGFGYAAVSESGVPGCSVGGTMAVHYMIVPGVGVGVTGGLYGLGDMPYTDGLSTVRNLRRMLQMTGDLMLRLMGMGRFTPFVGAGAGIYSLSGTGIGEGGHPFDYTESRLGFNVGGGFQQRVSDTMTLGIDIRYHVLTRSWMNTGVVTACGTVGFGRVH